MKRFKKGRNPFVNQVSFFTRPEGGASTPSGRRNPFVNQVSFFSPTMESPTHAEMTSQSLRKSGQFLSYMPEFYWLPADESQSLRKSGQFLFRRLR